MRYLATLLLAALSLNTVGQTQLSIPYNPDGNADGLIGINDLLEILALFGSEFSPEELVYDDHSAILHLGSMDYFDCASSCEELQGNWKLLDEMLIGRYRSELSVMGSQIWLDRRVFKNSDYNVSPYYLTQGNYVEGAQLEAYKECVCQTRVVLPVLVPVGPCETGLDLCGVCGGSGPIYNCGCHDMPEGACDCEGNQLDALGVCGGNCLGDYDGDGVCDVFPEGVCSGLESLEYDNYTYDLVEIGGRCWFTQNLRTEHYSNGDSIPYTQEPSIWTELGGNYIGARSVSPGYEYNGDLYNWYTTIDERGLCPTGWSVPEKVEFDALLDSLDLIYPLGGAIITALLDENTTTVGSNTSGFSATVTEYINSSGSIIISNPNPFYWTASYSSSPESWSFILPINYAGYNGSLSALYGSIYNDYPRGQGNAVRCIKD